MRSWTWGQREITKSKSLQSAIICIVVGPPQCTRHSSEDASSCDCAYAGLSRSWEKHTVSLENHIVISVILFHFRGLWASPSAIWNLSFLTCKMIFRVPDPHHLSLYSWGNRVDKYYSYVHHAGSNGRVAWLPWPSEQLCDAGRGDPGFSWHTLRWDSSQAIL